MGNSRPLLIVVLLIGLGFLSFLIFRTDVKKREVKEDLIELSKIKYGLFNVDEWEKIMSDVLTNKIEEFEIDSTNKVQMKKKVSDLLYKVIGDLEARYYEQNSGSIGGFLKSGVAHMTGTFGKIKEDIPIFTNQILDFLDDPKNKNAVRGYLLDKLNDYAENTFAELDYTLHDDIISKYHFAERHATIAALDKKLDAFQQQSDKYKYVLVLFSILTALFILFTKSISRTEFILLILTSFLFLIIGLTLPMIEIDARVSEIKISLLGDQIHFKDQVLFYKSKSILEVVRLMITRGSFDLLLVGILVFVFSVLFPLSKLISSIFLVSSPNLKSNKLVSFLVNKTGKWSMADVMVVAIFMAYIGFSGILTEQLYQLETLSPNIDVLTTNKSSLQTGFFAFTAFVLLSLLTTNKLKGISLNSTEDSLSSTTD